MELRDPVELLLQLQRLESREGRSDTQVDLLACFHGVAQVRIRRSQRAHGVVDVAWDERGEVRTENLEMLVGLLADPDDLVADRLTLAIAVEPEDQHLAGASEVAQLTGERDEVLEEGDEASRKRVSGNRARPMQFQTSQASPSPRRS
jgi:hypothetical protein